MSDLDRLTEELLTKRNKKKENKGGEQITYTGKPIGVVGTERVILETNTLRFIEVAPNVGSKTMRYGISEKGLKPISDTTYVDSEGNVCTLIARNAFISILSTLNNAIKQLREATRELERTTQERDSYKMMIDTLRKHNIID